VNIDTLRDKNGDFYEKEKPSELRHNRGGRRIQGDLDGIRNEKINVLLFYMCPY
jgi:hypothetical protein